uniref:Utp12 domain-containing protein n=1 Tax=Wuchereria bancrofti TaxID=6293 RepID=A0A1I8EHA5_WUCBA
MCGVMGELNRYNTSEVLDMLRRSRRLSEAKEATHYNGGAINKKKIKFDDNDVMTCSEDGETVINNSSTRVIILKYNPFDENHEVILSKKSSKTNLKDMPLKERRKTVDEREIHDHKSSKMEDVDSISENVRDFGVDEKASTSNTYTEEAITKSDMRSMDGESLAVILNQGLTSSDAEKIDAVLLKADAQTISATLNDLPVTQIIPLLKEIEYRCRNRRHFEYVYLLLQITKSCWMRWLQCILSKHMAYLCTIGTLKEDLSSLFGWFSKRAANIDELLQVSGKLSLINEQINRRMCPQLFVSQQPSISFEDDGDISETSGEMNDLDDEEESIESVEKWWDDEEVGSGGSHFSSGKRFFASIFVIVKKILFTHD